MNKSVLIVTGIVCLLFSSCVTSLQPLVTYDKVITDDRLAGKWKTNDGEFKVQPFFKSDLFKKHQKEFEKELNEKDRTSKVTSDSILYSKSYAIEYIKNGVQYDLLGSLIRLDGVLFINFTPVNSAPVNDTAIDASIDPASSLNTYTIAKVQFTGSSSLRLDFIDGGFLYEQVKAGRMKIKHENDDLYDTFLITASSKDLQQFLEKYGNDNRFFNKENSVILNRKS
jgi:hypothetical protein